MAAPHPLLIDLGDPGALAAALTRAEPGRIRLWHPVATDDAAAARHAAARRHAELLDVELLTEPFEGRLPTTESPGEATVWLLVAAAHRAIQLGCGHVIWPVHAGVAGDHALSCVDLAGTVEDLVRFGSGFDLELPLLELEPDQVIDLIDDAGGPVDACWPCEHGDAAPCGQCGSCRQWRRAYRQLGLAWPWTEHATPVDVAG